MRNLKKFLALVLAVMMVMSLMVTVNAKTVDDFADKDEVKAEYKDATNILLALGAIAGKSDTTLAPEGKLTRDELAVLLYTINRGNDGKDDYVLQTMKGREYDGSFTDVRGVSDGMVQFINYAVYYGWMNGTSATKFSPKGTVTLPQMLLAMLNVLGRSDSVIGGSTWVLDTIMAAQEAEILTGIDMTNPNRSITRQEAFQIAYNAMQKTYQSGPHYTVYEMKNGQWTIILRTTIASALTPYMSDASKYKVEERTIPSAANGQTPLQYIYKSPVITPAIGPDGKVNDDGYGRPVMTVTPNGGDPVKIPVAPVATYPSGELTGAIAKTYAQAVMSVYYNGDTADNPNQPLWQQYKGDTPNNKGLWYDDNTGIPGMEIEIYSTGKNASGKDTYNVVVNEAYVGVVNKASNGDVSVTVKWDDGSDTPHTATVAIAPTHDCYAAINAHANGDLIAVYLKGSDIYNVAELETVEVETITRLNKGHKAIANIIADGDEYGFNNEAILRKGDGSWDRISSDGVVGKKNAVLHMLYDNILVIDLKSADGDDTEPETSVDGYAVVTAMKTKLVSAAETDAFGRVVPGSKPTFSFAIELVQSDGKVKSYNMDTIYVSNATEAAKYSATPGDIVVEVGTGYVKVATYNSLSIETPVIDEDETVFSSVYGYVVDGETVALSTLTAEATSGDITESGMYLYTNTAKIEKTSKSVDLSTIGAKAIINSDTVFIFKVVDAQDNVSYVAKSVSDLGKDGTPGGTTVGNSKAKIVVDVTKPASGDNTYVAKYVFVAHNVPFTAADDTVGDVEEYVYINTSESAVEVAPNGGTLTIYKAYAADGTRIELTKGTGTITDGVYTYNENKTVNGGTGASGNKVADATVSGDTVTAPGGVVTGTVKVLSGSTIAIHNEESGDHYFTYTVGSEVIVATGAKLEVGAGVHAVVNANGVVVALWVTTAKPAA